MKYYSGEILNICGDVEIIIGVRFAVKKRPAKFLNAVASTLWGKSVKGDDCFVFPNGISTYALSHRKITKEIFNALNFVIPETYVDANDAPKK